MIMSSITHEGASPLRGRKMLRLVLGPVCVCALVCACVCSRANVLGLPHGELCFRTQTHHFVGWRWALLNEAYGHPTLVT